MEKEFLEFLMQFLSEERQELFVQNAALRTRYITVVLEDLYQPHNAGAIMRTCDCFGIQDVHVIENRNKWKSSKDVERGSSKWINIYRYKKDKNNTPECITALKEKGYKLVATTPHTEMTLSELPLEEPIALFFGTEKDGVSQEVLTRSDYQIKIPMYGFTESFNISVAAAICLHSLRERMHQSDSDWQLTENEKVEIMIKWCKKSIDRFKQYEKQYLKRFNP